MKEREIAEQIFALFRKMRCRENEGFMDRNLNASIVDKLNPKEKDLFNSVYVGLQCLDYIKVDDDNRFIRLTANGYEKIYDEEKMELFQSLPWIIPNPQTKNWDLAYNRLWKVIGPQDSAFLYLSGGDFYKLVNDLCDDIPPTYSLYINERREKNQSTNRSVYYKDLIDHLSEDKKLELYVKIQIEIDVKLEEKQERESEAFDDDLLPSNIEGNKNTKEVSIVPTKDEEKRPKVFISYSWDNDPHSEWILKLAADLTEKGGLEVILDKWEMNAGKLLPNFMETSIREADRVICVLTPKYKERAENLEKGVGYESAIISAEVLSNIKTDKFIPLVRNGKDEEAIPSVLKSRLYVDMREDSKYDEKFDELIRVIWNKPLIKKTKIGPIPKFD